MTAIIGRRPIHAMDTEGELPGVACAPFVIRNLPDGWMLSAWCELRQDSCTGRQDLHARSRCGEPPA